MAEPHNTFHADCEGANCGAIADTIYSDIDGDSYADIGVWRYANTTASPTLVNVIIGGTLNKDATLILTNQGCASTSFSSAVSPNISANLNNSDAGTTPENKPNVNRIPDQIRRFQPPTPEPTGTSGPARSLRASTASSMLNDNRQWYDHEGDLRDTTLFELRTANDGRRINFWVEDEEYGPGKVTSEQLQTLADAFAVGSDSVYSMATSLAGQPWGSHIYSNLIGPTQPIDVVLLNLNPLDGAWGLVGFFWGKNNYLNGIQYGNETLITSNESLSFYLDTETLYLDSAGLQFEISTLAHELVHMINFYQRFIIRSTQTIDYSFDTWLEEMTALMMEDIVGSRLDASYHVIRDDRFPKWLAAGDFNCDITQFDDDTDSPCFGYNLTGSFGAWLLRHYGIDFYKSLLRNTSSTDSIAILDNAIRTAGGTGFKDAVQRWGTLLALLPADNSPPTFGLPERNEQGFTMPAIDGSAYTMARQLPGTSPSSLVQNGHFLEELLNIQADPYVRTVTVPPYTTLTVIVQ